MTRALRRRSSHSGTATANLFTESTLSSYSGNTNLVSPARKYATDSSPSIRTVISEPITFSALRQSPQIAPIGGGEGAIQLNAASNGITLTPATKHPERLVAEVPERRHRRRVQLHESLRRRTARRPTTRSSTQQPTCTFVQTYTLNPGGEDIYTTEDVIVSGVVNGQVTVYTAGGGKASSGDGSSATGDVVVGGNISYLARAATCSVRLQTQNVIIALLGAQRSAQLARGDDVAQRAWESDYDTPEPGLHRADEELDDLHGVDRDLQRRLDGRLRRTRTYNYDPTLRYLPPPDYPQIPAALKVMYERQIPSP